jgi:hypothetical protein
MAYGDAIVIDITRNLLLIMSNLQHVAQNNEVIYLLYSKYPAVCVVGIIFIPNRFSDLGGILSKLFIVSVLGTRLHTVEVIFP